jgi:hypothetical protein
MANARGKMIKMSKEIADTQYFHYCNKLQILFTAKLWSRWLGGMNSRLQLA